jgi:leukotriene A-4 hydrolase/aminopeptidase
MTRLDPHSYNDANQPDVAHVTLALRVDFAARTLAGAARLRLREAGSGPLDLDTRELAIRGVRSSDGTPLAFELAPPEQEVPWLGSRLRVNLPAGTREIVIEYATSPQASALQWLTPEMTAGGAQPFLFSQCQAIHARSIVPLQDTPRVRVTYDATLDVPRPLRGLMAAAFVRREEGGDRAVEHWTMPQPIPPYLIALAVGDLASRDVGPRSRVWAEPSVVESAAWEFAEVDRMLLAAEKLFGPYDWDRFDLLCMPPSFPYGGMENPRLTFLTPTLLAGDRSLTSVVAHELAHSWTGNLVSNASAEHFWLNEGFTVFAERRIVEALYGGEMAQLQAALGRLDLDAALKRFAERPQLQRLRTPMQGVDPDDAFSEVPYEKGYLFLRTIEEAVGRARFDGFLRAYLQRYRFSAITSDDFVRALEDELPGVFDQVEGRAWLDGAGVPPNAPPPRSTRLDNVRALVQAGRVPTDGEAARLSPTEWQLYLDGLPRPSTLCAELDKTFSLNASRNYEVLASWLLLAIDSGYEPALPRAEEVLAHVGRMKYLKPLYRALAGRKETRDLAGRVFERARHAYHPIAQQVVAQILS